MKQKLGLDRNKVGDPFYPRRPILPHLPLKHTLLIQILSVGGRRVGRPQSHPDVG